MRSNLIKAIDDPTNFHKWGEKKWRLPEVIGDKYNLQNVDPKKCVDLFLLYRNIFVIVFLENARKKLHFVLFTKMLKNWED